MKGSYLLLLELKENKTLQVGANNKISFNKGFYVYVGSALNGLEQRIQRHLRRQKKIHWHIDYLLQYAKIKDVFYKESDTRSECDIAQQFDKKLVQVPCFGCSDCTCQSHLFHGKYTDIMNVVDEIEMKPYPS